MKNRNRAGGLSFYHKEKKETKGRLRNAAGYVFAIFLGVLLASVMVYAVGIRTSMVGSSMQPTLNSGQEILINRFSYNFFKPKFNDVVVFHPNGNESAHLYVRRVVGIPGDTIQIVDGTLYRNGAPQTKMFSDRIADPGNANEMVMLGNDEYFVMGDNCNSSEDSRSANIGIVRKDTIYGKVWFHMASGSEGIGLIR